MGEHGETACAVCARKLDHIEHPDGREEWAHSAFAENDHLPVPVHESTIETIYSCDFCGQTPADFVLPVSDFVQDVPERKASILSNGDWATCWTCSALIASGQWHGIMLRVVRAWQVKHGEPMNRAQRLVTWEYYVKVRDHIRGPLRER